MKTARTIIMTLSSVMAVLVLALLVAVPTQAALLETLSIEPNDTSPSATSVTHSFSWTHGTAATIKSFKLQYCTNPSGAGGACTAPADLDVQTVTMSGHVNMTNVWTLGAAAANSVVWYYSTGEAVIDGTVWEFDMASVDNQAIDDCQAGGDASSDTCYVRVFTYVTADATGSVTDSNVGSVTVVSDVTVTATVDPSFTFVVSAVGASTVNNSITTSVSSAYNTLPFSNLTAGTPKYAAHKLNVTTNANNGYSIYTEMENDMTGLYAANNIDEFVADWSAATTWTEPTGSTPNSDTGWIGANTTDADVTGGTPPDTDSLFGAIGTTPSLVSYDTNQDDGTTSVYVTYALEVNFYQPADQYTGIVQYTALPSY